MMRRINFWLIVAILLFGFFEAIGQSIVAPDTIYIYETVVVYDTVRLVKPKRIAEKRIKSISPVNYSSSNQLAVKKVGHHTIFSSSSATIPQSSIIGSKSKTNIQKNESMKAKHFLAIAIIALQTSSYAQPRYGITAGGGVWWAHGIRQNAVTEVAPTFNLGAFICKPVISNKVNFEWELQYSFLASNYSYKGKSSPELWMSIGDSEAATAYHQFAIPFRVEWVLGKFTPFIGAEYTYRRAENWVKDVNGNTLSMNRLGIITGLKYTPSSTWSFGVAYDGGLTDDFTLNHLVVSPEGMASGLQIWKSSWVGLSAFYTFNGMKKSSVEIGTETNADAENISPSSDFLYSLVYRMSMASQVFSYVETDDPDQYIERFLPGVGVGFGVSKKLNRYFDIKPQISYIRKGCSGNEIPDIHPTTSPEEYYVIMQTATYKNQFHYLSLDVLTKIQSPKSRKINPYFQTGLRGDALIAKSINYLISHNSESYYKDFNRFNYGMVNALGLTFNNNYYIEMEHNFDFGYLVKNEGLKVKNWMWGVNVGILLNQ